MKKALADFSGSEARQRSHSEEKLRAEEAAGSFFGRYKYDLRETNNCRHTFLGLKNNHKLRRKCSKVLCSWIFDLVVNASVIINCIFVGSMYCKLPLFRAHLFYTATFLTPTTKLSCPRNSCYAISSSRSSISLNSSYAYLSAGLGFEVEGSSRVGSTLYVVGRGVIRAISRRVVALPG